MRIRRAPVVNLDELQRDFKKSSFYREKDNLYRLFPNTENGSYEWLVVSDYEEAAYDRGEDCLFCRVIDFLESIGVTDDVLVCVFW